MTTKALCATILTASVTAFSNSVPVYGNFPGWYSGKGEAGITVQLYIDLLCSDCASEYTTWNSVLQEPWLNGTVSDYVFWGYTPMSLPYHVHTFEVQQVVPYLQALCAEDNNDCGLLETYKDYCFAEGMDNVLSMTDVSHDDFITYWSNTVATVLMLNAENIYEIYGNSDSYDTNMNTRAMWKYAMAQGISGTPTAFMNGVKLDNMPTTVDKWIKYLNSVYNSQYGIVMDTETS